MLVCVDLWYMSLWPWKVTLKVKDQGQGQNLKNAQYAYKSDLEAPRVKIGILSHDLNFISQGHDLE